MILIINISIIIFIILIQNNLPPQVPLFYGKPYGAEQLTTSISLVFPPLLSIVVSIINSIVIFLIEDDFLQKILLVSMYTLTLLSAITVIKIIFLIGNVF